MFESEMDGIVYLRRCLILVLYLVVTKTTTSRTKSFDVFVACLQQPTRTSSSSSSSSTTSISSTTTTTIQVCQNKACCQRWKLKTSLPDVLHDLLCDNAGNNKSKISIDVTSCLSQCDKGPNLCIIDTSNNNNKKRDDIYVNGINDVISLITQLDEILSINVSSKLIAATNVYEKALNAPTLDEKLRYTSSILRVLDDDPNLSKSTAKFRTSLYHAEIIFESGNDQDAMNILNEVIPQLLVLYENNNIYYYYKNLLSKAYRIIADIYEQNQNYTSAIDAVQCIGKINPEMKSKVIKEIDRLQQLVTT